MKTDLTKLYKSYYTAKAKPELITIEKVRYISIAGKGDPSSAAFAEKISTLYPAAYALKFISKAAGNDYIVPKLEALWWFDEEKYKGFSIAETPQKIPRSEWQYRLLLRLPEFVSKEQVSVAIALLIKKKNLAAASEIEFFELEEGRCLQMLHTGPFDKEPETLALMADFMNAHQFGKNGLHHEIYLTDFRKTAPEKLRTILREPVVKIKLSAFYFLPMQRSPVV